MLSARRDHFCTTAWQAQAWFVTSWRGAAYDHSRDRHGSIFDGAEWDELWSGGFWLGPAMHGLLSRCWFGMGKARLATSLVVGTVASSRARRGM